MQVTQPRQAYLGFPRWLILLTAVCSIILTLVTIGLYVHYRAIVQRHLNSEKWSLPSTIFADSLILRKGVPIQRSEIIEYLQSLDYFWAKHPDVRPGQYSIFPGGIRFQRRPFLFKDSGAPIMHVTFDSFGI